MPVALVIAFLAGAIATVNPCGWALLPAWFARRLEESGGAAPVPAALRAGALATLGFIIIFGLAGAVMALGALWLGPLLPFVGLGVGVVLAVVGLVSLCDGGWGGVPGGGVCRRIGDRHGSLVFGIGYGLLSLSCTLPIFLSALGLSLTGTPVDLVVNLLAYALGMGTVLSSLGVVAATTGAGFGTLSPQAHRLLRKSGAVLLLLAATYVIYYWGRVVFGDVMVESRVVGFGDGISATLRIWLAYGAGRWVLVVSLGVLLFLGLAAALRAQRWSRRTGRAGQGKRHET